MSTTNNARVAARSLWALLFEKDDIIEVRALSRACTKCGKTVKGKDCECGGKPGRRCWWGTMDGHARGGLKADIERAGKDGFDIYFGVNPRTDRTPGKIANINTFRALVVDLDHCTRDEAGLQLDNSKLPTPTAAIASGNGVHYYWRLEDAIDADRWKMAQKAIIALFPSADKAIHDAPRIMRLPRTVNTKNGAVAEMMFHNDTRHKLSSFLRPRSATDPLSRALAYFAKKPGVAEGGRNVEAFKVAATCIRDFELDTTDAVTVVMSWDVRNSPPLGREEIERTVASAATSARGVPGAKNRDMPNQQRPTPQRPTTTQPPTAPAEKAPAGQADNAVLQSLARNCALIVGTTQVWHEELGISMELAALTAMHPVEAKIWKSARDKRAIRQTDIVFEPDTSKVLPGQVNLWKGLAVTPDPRPCPRLLNHILMLCNGDETVSTWLLRWMALPVRSPGTKLDTAVIMQGPQGTGKSMLWTCYRSIFGDHGTKITQTTLDTPYSGWMSRRLFVQAEEVGSTKGQRNRIRNLIKDWVTGEQVEIHEKYQVSRVERCYANFVFLSNDAVPLPIDADDRRFTVVETENLMPKPYFAEVAAEIEDNGPARLLHALLNLDMGDFNPHTPAPITTAKMDLMDLCKPSHQVFYEAWAGGDIERLPFTSCKIADLYQAYCAWCKLEGVGFPSDKVSFGKWLGKILPQVRCGGYRYWGVDGEGVSMFEAALEHYIRHVENRRAR